MFQDSQRMSETMDGTDPVYTAFSYAYITFHLIEALYSYSLAHSNWRHHYSCASGPLLSKIRVTWQLI